MNYRTSPAFTLPLSQKKTILDMPSQDYSSPGPIYNTWGLGHKHKTTGQSIGSSKRTNINHWIQPTPSPANYSPNKKHNQHAVTISKANPNLKLSSGNPDPSCYNPQISKIKPKLPVYSMGIKYGSIMDDINKHPGPGYYESQREDGVLGRSKSYKQSLFSTEQRFRYRNCNPGVGDYQISRKQDLITNKGTIGHGEREPITRPNFPAATDYQKLSIFQEGMRKKTGKSLAMKLNGCFNEEPLTSEAFLKYSPSNGNHFPSSQQFSISKQQREIFKGNLHPGPSDYNSHCYNPKSSHGIIIATSHYLPYNQTIDNPAPNAYHIQKMNGPKYTIPRAKSASMIRDHPGVGRYNITKGIGVRAGSAIPKSARTNFLSKNNAGVGDYQILQKRQSKGTIGKSQRFKKTQTKPGPGDYHIQSIIGYKSKHL